MARRSGSKRGVATSSSAALAAVIIGSAGLAAPPPAPKDGQAAASAERSANWEKMAGQAKAAHWWKYKSEFKHKGEYSVAGQNGGRIIFEDDRGNLFYVDEATGDQKFVKGHVYTKVELQKRDYVYHPMKMRGRVTILGVDESGKLLMRNKAGETFHLDSATGDMIFVK